MKDKEVRREYKDQNQRLKLKEKREKEPQKKKLILFRVEFMIHQRKDIELIDLNSTN